MSFLENEITNITILKEVKKVHKDAFKNNIYLSDVDRKNNGLFENSSYHKIIELALKDYKFEFIQDKINKDIAIAIENISIASIIQGIESDVFTINE